MTAGNRSRSLRRRRLAGGGTIRLPKGDVGRVAAEIVRKFPPCGPAGAHLDLRVPPQRWSPACTIWRGVNICAEPVERSPDAPRGPLVAGGGYLPYAGQIRVRVDASCCAPVLEWQAQLRSALRHEMTHAEDPYLRKRRKPYSKPGVDDESYCRYVRDPSEQAAYLAEVRGEVLAAPARHRIERLVRKGLLRRPGEILEESETYSRIASCLTPRQRRRFLQMAARIWQSGRLGPLPPGR